MFKGNTFYKYAVKKKAKHLLHLPFEVSIKVQSLSNEIEQHLVNFIDLAKSYFEEERGFNKNEKHTFLEQLYVLKDGIINTLRTKDYQPIKEALDNIQFIDCAPKYELTSDEHLFRSRPGIHTMVNEFYHPPFDNKTINSKNGRFDTQDCISWYLGRSEKVCKLEIHRNNKEKTYSTISLHLKREESFPQIVDMTSEAIHTQKNSECEYEIVLFPLFLACYCLTKNKEIERDIYLIPQFLARYIHENREKMKVIGIQYFTVRNEGLNPSENIYKNICIFPEESNKSEDGYDMTLMNKFEFGKPKLYLI